MNYLAHLALSGSDAQVRTGGFLGDWLKGPLHQHTEHWPAGVIAGVRRHRDIDAWIDRQPETATAMALLGPRYRRVAGPVIDIMFDHFLAQQFSRWHQPELALFCTEVFRQLGPFKARMPSGAQRFLERAQSHKLFERYGDKATIYGVVASLQRRLSKPELLANIEPVLVARDAELAEVFNEVYPKLLTYVNSRVHDPSKRD